MTAFGGFRRWVVVEATLVPGTLRGDTECTGQVNRARCPRGVPRLPAPRTLTPGPGGLPAHPRWPAVLVTGADGENRLRASRAV